MHETSFKPKTYGIKFTIVVPSFSKEKANDNIVALNMKWYIK